MLSVSIERLCLMLSVALCRRGSYEELQPVDDCSLHIPWWQHNKHLLFVLLRSCGDHSGTSQDILYTDLCCLKMCIYSTFLRHLRTILIARNISHEGI